MKKNIKELGFEEELKMACGAFGARYDFKSTESEVEGQNNLDLPKLPIMQV